MKSLVVFTLLIFIRGSGFSQSILEALQLKEDSIGEYIEGEAVSTDTIIDIRNGYYEEFASYEDGNKTVTRQASIFHNHDGSKILGISITEWDFQCFNYETNFYKISKSKDSIGTISNKDILPLLNIKELVADSNVFYIFNKYLPEIQENYLDSNATIDEVLSEVYSIIYILPRRGTDLIATLRVCDYIPTNEVNISRDDWSIIEKSILFIELEYDKIQKKFKKKNANKK
jgi:hypothetical protein